MIGDKDCQEFLKKVGETHMSSVFATKGHDRESNSNNVRYTIFIPKTGYQKLKGEDAKTFIKSHVIKNAFTPDFIKKTCEKYKEPVIKMRTMNRTVLSIDCKDKTVQTSDGKTVKLDKCSAEARNGVIYMIKEPLATGEEIVSNREEAKLRKLRKSRKSTKK
jgi:hypothetical protein